MEKEAGEESSANVASHVTGFVDYTPQEQCLFHDFLDKITSVYRLFGFTQLHLRPVERIQALQGDGETNKQIFELFRADTQKTTGLGLPFDHTVPLALWVAEHAGRLQKLHLPYKRYDMGLVYRGERPKTGRLRSFIQADIDIVGRKLPLSADKECLLALLQALALLNVGDFTLHLNHIAVVQGVLDHYQIDQKERAPFLRAIDKLDKLSSQEVEEEIVKTTNLTPSQRKTLLTFFVQTPSLDDPIWSHEYGERVKQGISEIKHLVSCLTKEGIEKGNICFSMNRVRGLDYYTGIVFETFLQGKESYGSIASGGRYSNLVGEFAEGLSDVEGVGGSIGLTRLIDILIKTESVSTSKQTLADVLIGARTEELFSLAESIASKLRARSIKVDLYSGASKVKQILSHADAIGISKVILVMDESAFVVKEMLSKEQVEFSSVEPLLTLFGER